MAWRAAAHGFSWLRDLRALGTDPARLRARDLAEDWLVQGGAEEIALAPEVAAARVSAWLGHWDFMAATAEDGFRKRLLVRLAQDARGVVASLPAEAMHRGALATLKGAMAAAVALGEEAWLNRALRFLPGELQRQFHPDGGHVERSPGQQLLALQDLIEIRNLLHGSGVNAPPELATAMERWRCSTARGRRGRRWWTWCSPRGRRGAGRRCCWRRRASTACRPAARWWSPMPARHRRAGRGTSARGCRAARIGSHMRGRCPSRCRWGATG